MQGRWNTVGSNESALREEIRALREQIAGMVPCDDAAVRRATDAALAEMLRLLATDNFDEREGDESPERFVARKAMEAGFRAAGETP